MIDESKFHEFPLCVDLDGTLWPGDCLFLCIRSFLKKYPWKFLNIFLWYLNGRTNLKSKVLEGIIFDPAGLNYFSDIISYLKLMKNKGAKIYLVTGSDQLIADSVAKHLNFFDGAFGSCGNINLVGQNKANLLNNLFGKFNYIYFGNEWKDTIVWNNSKAAVAVNVCEKTKSWLEKKEIFVKYFY